MQDYTFRLATAGDKPAIFSFIETHWDLRTPLIHHPDMFRYYYENEDGSLRFALAEQQGKIVALAGYIPANASPTPDIWVSIWVADKTAKGSGLELMAAIPALTNCRTMACNNIRPKTRAFYEFLGYSTGNLGHFYRLAPRETYQLAKVENPCILPVTGKAALRQLYTPQALQQSGFTPPQTANPYKDIAYLSKRYFGYPHQQYNVFGAYAPDESTPFALLVSRCIPALSTKVLRIVEYCGNIALLPQLGQAIDALLQEENAEYADFYCAGISAHIMAETGFSLREEQDTQTILPNYLSPPLLENTNYYYFTSQPQNFTMFKADGDQDRPNLPV